MALDVVALLATARGDAYRRICTALGKDFEGLSVAARMAKQAGAITPDLAKKLQRLDTAYAFARHISTPKVESLGRALAAQLSPSHSEFVLSDSEATASSGDCESTSCSNCTATTTTASKTVVRDLVRDQEVSVFSLYDSDCDTADAVAQTDASDDTMVLLPAAGTMELASFAHEALLNDLDLRAEVGLVRLRTIRLSMLEDVSVDVAGDWRGPLSELDALPPPTDQQLLQVVESAVVQVF